MKVLPLQSGSSGNCFYVETDRTRILIDAGISPRQTSGRLQRHGRDIHSIDAVLLTHDHSDHSRYVSKVCGRFDLPLYVTQKTFSAIERKQDFPQSLEINRFKAGQSFQVGDLQIHSIPTPHDAIDGVAFVVEHESKRLGVLTDLGHAFNGLREILESLDAVIIESNYDDSLLDEGPYPEFLKRRIRGQGGHLSNLDSARLLHQGATERMQWICLCHLSEKNNSVETAIRIHQNWLGEQYPIYVARRKEASEVLELKNIVRDPQSEKPQAKQKIKPARKMKTRTGQR